MKATHLNRREPAKSRSFSWARFPMAEGGPICYRLFRRDHRGALHMAAFYFKATDSREGIAGILRRARHALRDRVDEIDLQAMEAA